MRSRPSQLVEYRSIPKSKSEVCSQLDPPMFQCLQSRLRRDQNLSYGGFVQHLVRFYVVVYVVLQMLMAVMVAVQSQELSE